MKYIEGLENQFEPRRVGLIKNGKKEVRFGHGSLVDAIDALEDGQYLRIPADVRILPADYVSARHFTKRGRHLSIPVPRSREDNLKEMKSLQTRIAERLGRAREDYRGYGWLGLNPERHKIIPITEVVEGLELYALQLDGRLERAEVEDYGERCFATVPSRQKGKKPHKVHIMTLADGNSGNPYADALDTEPGCSCEFSNYRGKLTYRYRRGEDRFCAHAIAAIYAIAEEKATGLAQSPVPIPKRALIEFNDKLRNSVIKRVRNRDAPLNEAEMEVLDWRLIKKHDESGKGVQELFWFDDTALFSKSAAKYAVSP
ncbi:MAG: hypothetical protein QXD77_02945 [Candidatus Aenigmatarchaeota archaeon]